MHKVSFTNVITLCKHPRGGKKQFLGSSAMSVAKVLMGLSLVFAVVASEPVRAWKFFGCFGFKDAVIEHGQKPAADKYSKDKPPRALKRSAKGGKLQRRVPSAAGVNSDSEDIAPGNEHIFDFGNPAYRAQHVMDARERADKIEEQHLAALEVAEFVNAPVEVAQARI
jgi:hypothetical protein